MYGRSIIFIGSLCFAVQGVAQEPEALLSTTTHRFFVLDDCDSAPIAGHWVEAEALCPGDCFLLADGTEAVLSSTESVQRQFESHASRPTVEPSTAGLQPITTHNFEVSDTHTYFVGSSGVWVHNTGEPCHVVYERPKVEFGTYTIPPAPKLPWHARLHRLINPKRFEDPLQTFTTEKAIVDVVEEVVHLEASSRYMKLFSEKFDMPHRYYDLAATVGMTHTRSGGIVDLWLERIGFRVDIPLESQLLPDGNRMWMPMLMRRDMYEAYRHALWVGNLVQRKPLTRSAFAVEFPEWPKEINPR